ncbi:MAG: hypothetical protein E6J52_04745 [Chloroflexi bacterium]|nr:MAG: hypothetical protein E6J52_04745 [Chloroflexota bacterium]
MARTSIVIDDALIRRVMRLYRLPTKRAAVDDYALRRLAGDGDRRKMLELRAQAGQATSRRCVGVGSILLDRR